MPDELGNVYNKVFGKKKEYNLIDVYHYLMIEYGYIPFEDFKKMDASLVNELVIRLNKMNEEKAKKNRRKK